MNNFSSDRKVSVSEDSVNIQQFFKLIQKNAGQLQRSLQGLLNDNMCIRL